MPLCAPTRSLEENVCVFDSVLVGDSTPGDNNIEGEGLEQMGENLLGVNGGDSTKGVRSKNSKSNADGGGINQSHLLLLDTPTTRQ